MDSYAISTSGVIMVDSKENPGKNSGDKDDIRRGSHHEDPEDVKLKGGSSTLSSYLCIVGKLLLSVLLGIVFGVAMEKTRVFQPQSIRLQMVFEKWIMLKMFLAAVASSMFSLSLLSLIPATQSRFQHASGAYASCLTKKGAITSCVGPFILGVGMTLAGSCPGMVLVQVGAWAPNSIFTLVGCLLGALLYGLVASFVDTHCQPKEPFKHSQVPTTFKKPFAVFAIPLAACVAVVVVLLEVFVDYKDDLEFSEKGKLQSNIIRTIAWPPYVGGILIGLLQIPTVLLLQDTIGGSSGYVTVASQWLVTPGLQKRFPYLAGHRASFSSWWQVFYVGGAILGGLSSASSSGSLASVPGVGVAEALCGGVLMLLGARLAGGCTSGHGISGVSLLVWLSFLAVPCMFGGAIVTAFIMRAANNSLDRLVTSTLTL